MALNLTPRRPAEELHALADALIRRGIAAARDNQALGSHLFGAGILREYIATALDHGATQIVVDPLCSMLDPDLQHELATKEWA